MHVLCVPGLGMILAVLPACLATPVSDRRSYFVGLGGMALVAQWLVGTWRATPWRGLPGGMAGRARRLAVIGLAGGLLWMHVLVPVEALGRRLASPPSSGSHPFLDIGDDPGLAGDEVILITAPDPFQTIFLPWERAYAREPIPRRVRLLAPALGGVAVTRSSASELVLRAAAGSLMTLPQPPRRDPVDDIWRLQRRTQALWSGDFPVPPGALRTLPGITVRVLQADASGLPVAVRFRFDQPLEAPGRRWLVWSWQQRRYLPFQSPPIGGTVAIAGPFDR